MLRVLAIFIVCSYPAVLHEIRVPIIHYCTAASVIDTFICTVMPVAVGTVKIKDENNIEVVYEYTKYSDIESALQFDMDNKPYYPGEYLFVKEDTYDGSPDNEGGRSIGDAIRYPFKFFSHEHTGSIHFQ